MTVSVISSGSLEMGGNGDNLMSLFFIQTVIVLLEAQL